MINVFTILVGKSVGKRLYGRPEHRWDQYIKICIKVIEYESVDRVQLAQNRI